MTLKHLVSTMAAAVLVGVAVRANAIDYSFTGNLVQDNTVQLFNFTVGAVSPDVILRTWSYAGGVNAAGQTIARGGFDPILAVFNSSGTLIGQNDDGWDVLLGYLVAADAVTGAHFDTYLDLGSMVAGTYAVSVMQYNNFAIGPALANGFMHDSPADAWFTLPLTGHTTGGFWDVTGNMRDSHWAFDILGVQAASQVPDGGSSMALLGFALTGLALVYNRIRK